MPRFKVLDGLHTESRVPAGVRGQYDMGVYETYRKGDIFESERNLDKMFANKFERINDPRTRTLAEQEVRASAVNELIRTGVWVEADRDMLGSLDNDQFNKIVEKTGSLAARAAHERPVDAATNQISEERKRDAAQRPAGKGVKSALGIDVTEQFPGARSNSLKVWCNPAGKHQITREGGKAPVNEKPLKQDEVLPFIESYSEQQKEAQPQQETEETEE